MSNKTAAFFFGIMWGILFATMFLWHNTPSINCPQEDSCYADYSGYDHAWHIYAGERP